MYVAVLLSRKNITVFSAYNNLEFSRNIFIINKKFLKTGKRSCLFILFHGIQLLQNDLESFTTGEKLNDKIVNFYLSLLSISLENLKALTIDFILINKILSSDLRGISRALDKYNQKNLIFFFSHFF